MNRTPYEVALEARTAAGPDTYRFSAADGVRSKSSLRSAELGLLDALWGAGHGRVLVAQANYGVVGTVLAADADEVVMTESSARAAALCERNAADNGVDATVRLTTDATRLDGDGFDAAAYAPRPDAPLDVAAHRLAAAAGALRPGGTLLVAASERSGLSRYRDAMEDCCASVSVVATRGDCEVVAGSASPPVEPPASVTPRTVEATAAGVELTLVTVPGLFSAAGLDDGTRLLLDAAAVADGDRVLDLCCGYGAIGAHAGRTADCDLWLTDDDAVATACAECSLEASGVDGTVVTADCLEGVADRRFDAVLCNPPTHAGDGVLAELFAGAADVLAPGGTCTLVHHRALDLRRHLGGFDEVERVREGEEHVVLVATV